MSRREELEKLAMYLKTSRERARLSVEDVASGAGCTARYIERIEEGSRYHRRPARERLQRICELVGADYDEARRVAGYPEKTQEVQAIVAGILAPVPSQEPPSTAEGDTTPAYSELWDEIEEDVRWLRDHDAPAGVQWVLLDQLEGMRKLAQCLNGEGEYDWQPLERADVVKQIAADVSYIDSQRPPMPMLWLLSLAVGSYAGLVSWRGKRQAQEHEVPVG